MRTAPGFSPWCKNRGLFGLYESCEEEGGSEEEALAVAAIDELQEP